MENISKIQNLINKLNTTIPSNYEVIKDVFNSEYGYPELDPLRNEICECIIFGLYVAAITSTNHLLEKSLKFCLSVQYSRHNKKNGANIEDAFIEGIEKYDNCDLEKTINQACSQGLITKEQKKQLVKLKNKFRNPYSHASTEVFEDRKVIGKVVSTKDLDDGFEKFLEKIFDSNSDVEMSLKNLPFAQGIFQHNIAKEDCLPYFQEVDIIIRAMLSNLKTK